MYAGAIVYGQAHEDNRQSVPVHGVMIMLPPLGGTNHAEHHGASQKSERLIPGRRIVGVRTRYEAVSVVTNADLNLTGTSRRSLLAGTVTVQRIVYITQSDVGSTLSKSAAPP